MLLLAVFIHTFTTLQGSYIGWIVDILLIVILGTFISIEPLRIALGSFFRLITVESNSMIQVLTCLVVLIAIYAVNIPIIRRKNIYKLLDEVLAVNRSLERVIHLWMFTT